jgi:hypothetical protein
MESTPAKKRLWLSVTIPPAVWAAQGLFGWFVSSHACPGTSQPWSISAARWAVVVSAGIALIVSVAALVVSIRKSREIDRSKDVERVRYLSMVGLLVAGSITLGLIYSGLSGIVINACGEMR